MTQAPLSRDAVLAKWEDDDEVTPQGRQKTYTQAELDNILAAASRAPRVGPEARALLRDFDNNMSIAALSVKYELSQAAVRARIRTSGRSIRKCPHCGGGL